MPKIVPRLRIPVAILFAIAACFSLFSGNSSATKHLTIALLEDYDKGQDLTSVSADFSVMNELGVHVWRGSFGWDDYEPDRGKFDFKWLHQFADLAAANGITLRPYIGYTPPWAAKGGTDKDAWNDPPKRLHDWQDFVGHLVTAMSRHRNIPSYEIYNEENVKMWWDGTSADYNRVLAEGAAAIRSAKPTLQVVFGGMVWPDPNWVEQACTTFGNAGHFDVIPFHAYPETWTPKDVELENYLDHYGQFLAAADQACGPKPIWINEAGFATMPPKTELDQANWWARALATFAAAPRVEEIGIYQIRDAAKDKPVIGDAANFYLGLLYQDRGKKLAFHTIQALAPLFQDETFTVADSEVQVMSSSGVPGRVYSHLFVRADGSQILFVWDKSRDSTLRLQLQRPGASAVEIKLDGERVAHPRFHDHRLDDVHLTPGIVRVFEILP